MTAMRVRDLHKAGAGQPPLAAVTAYDYTLARIGESGGADILLVGDSLGMVVQGEATTLPVTLAQMVYHTACVHRGRERALIVADLPFRSYKASPEQALDSAARLMAEGGAEMVKLEGGGPMRETVAFLVERGIPVMGHLGLTPQSVHQLGGYRVQGRAPDHAEALVRDARALAEAGVGALVLEAVPASVAERVTAELTVPVIGIGAGAGCDGQVLVMHDILGLSGDAAPRFAKRYMDGAADTGAAVAAFCREVRSGVFPEPQNTFE